MNQKELLLILEEGEGYRIEFKETQNGIDREMVAFANSSGGRIFIGVTDEDVISGITVTNKLKSLVQDMARNCRPEIKISIEVLDDILSTCLAK